MNDECATCCHLIGGECTVPTATAEYGECGHYEGCTGWHPKEEVKR